MKPKKKRNLVAIIAGLSVMIAGIAIIYADSVHLKTEGRLWVNVGCSLLASGIVIVIQAWFVDAMASSYVEAWGLTKVYPRRMDKSDDSDPRLGNVKQLDIIAFGLKTFRSTHKEKIEQMIFKGGRIRILTMDPTSQFVSQREKEEEEPEGQIKASIESLVKWADEINSKGWKGQISIKGYSCMTLDFYWRADDEIWFGPYWLGISSQQTVTYKIDKGPMKKKGFDVYTNYFEKLWTNDGMRYLTKPISKSTKTRRKNGR